jgi:predicted GNAT family acetyltransferase
VASAHGTVRILLLAQIKFSLQRGRARKAMKQSDPIVPIVRHDTAAQRFEIVLGDHRAGVDYVIDGGSVIFTHTFVPPELRGRGVAEILVRAALDWARQERKRVVPACSYVAKFIERHPDYRDLLAGD